MRWTLLRDSRAHWRKLTSSAAPLNLSPIHKTKSLQVTPCPTCYARSAVIRVRHCSNGTIRRRLECSCCGHRWTTHQGERPRNGGRRAGTWHSRDLRPDEVLAILNASGSIRSIARQVGRSAPAVADVLAGRTHTHVSPDLPRRQGLTCLQCQHWTGRCRMGFPDPEEEGPQAAAWCNSYDDRS